MNFFLMLMNMLPGIIGLIKQVEPMFPGKDQGRNKLNLVLNTVNAAAQSVPAIAATVGNHDLNGSVTAIVGAAVTTLNAAGALNVPTPAAPPAPPAD